MKVPRKPDCAAEVTIAIAGTNLPLTNMKNGVVMHNTPHTGKTGAWVIAKMGSIDNPEMTRNVFALP